MTKLHPKQVKEQIVNLHKEGKTAGEIAAVFGMTRNSVIGVIHRSRITAGVAWTGPRKKEVTRRIPKPPTIARPISATLDRLLEKKETPPRGRIMGLYSFAHDRFDEPPEAIEIPERDHWGKAMDAHHRPGAAFPVKPVDILHVRECRAPVATRARVHLFCDMPRKVGSSYCPDHHVVFNIPPRTEGARR
jgi:hypothetical protein